MRNRAVNARDRDALATALGELVPPDPFAASVLRLRLELGLDADASALFEYWDSRAPGNPRGDMRYRWELTHRRGVPMPPYAPEPRRWGPWRAAEQPMFDQDPFAFEERLSTPVVLTENAELLAEAGAAGNALAARLVAEAAPVLRRDFAGFVQERDPWQDTFALWCLVRRPRTLALLHPLAVAIATCYAAGIPDDRDHVSGQRFPFHQAPLASASAQLATALLSLGSDLALVARLAAFVDRARLPSGGWGDASERADVLSTLVAADLTARVDPAFDPAPTRRVLAQLAGKDGLWRAVGPDAPWLTSELLALLDTFERPFAERFRWPFLAAENRDRKTRLPFFAYFADLARLMSALPGLASAESELVFIDLVGFRAFNNLYGQDAGDAVLAAFAAELETIASARAVRDGGDEFLVIGAPLRGGLSAELEKFRHDWPNRFRARFGSEVPPVAPRILVGRGRAGRLLAAREELGRAITGLKNAGNGGDGAGVLLDAGEIG
jgi:GGDEF domain-containing protein